MQGDDSNANLSLDYYPSIDQIFWELSRQVTTKKNDFSIEELLTDQEKEEDYELNLYINTFVSEETPIEHNS